jgi:hypothetical protein
MSEVTGMGSTRAMRLVARRAFDVVLEGRPIAICSVSGVGT